MLYAFAEPLVRIITPDEGAIALAKKCLRIVAFVQPIQTVAWIYAGALRGAGDTKWPFYITAACNWGIRTLGAWLCIRVFRLGLPQAVMCMCADNFVRMICMGAHFHKGAWKHVLDKKELPTSH